MMLWHVWYFSLSLSLSLNSLSIHVVCVCLLYSVKESQYLVTGDFLDAVKAEFDKQKH